MQKAVIVIFDKFEEIEAITPTDILRRAGVEVSVLTLSPILSTCGRSGLSVCADAFLSDHLKDTFDAVVISGGPGTPEAAKSGDLLKFAKRHADEGKIVAAICAAPVIFEKAGLLAEKDFTSHTSVISQFARQPSNADVVKSGNVITSRGAGTALPFALEIARALKGESVATEIAASICYTLHAHA